jgi:hypothetical protein
MDMKSLHRIACFAALALAVMMTMPAFAASGPPDVPTPDPIAMSIEAPAVTGAPIHNVCMFAIVEDLATCSIGVAAVAGECPAIVARIINAMGAAAIATPSFADACAPLAAPPD